MNELRAARMVTAAPSTTVRPFPPAAGVTSSVVPDVTTQLERQVNTVEQGVLNGAGGAVDTARILRTGRSSARAAGPDGWAADPEEAAHPSQVTTGV